MNPTSQDVAKRAGVSRSTVSQILNGRADYFTEETRARVARAVVELGYEPSAAGRTLARGSSDVVIALIPNTTFGHNLQDIYESLTDELAKRGLTLVLRLAGSDASSLDRLIKGLSPRAIISLMRLPEAQRAVIERQGVELLEPNASLALDSNAQIGAFQARYLIDRGYQRLAFAHLHDTRSDPFGGPREALFAAECSSAGLEAPRILYVSITLDSARAALDNLGDPGFAVGCYNDEVASALLFAAHERGWRIPDELALIGMDDTPLARFTNPPLTTVGYDTEEATVAALEQLLSRLDRRHEPEMQPQFDFRTVEGGTA